MEKVFKIVKWLLLVILLIVFIFVTYTILQATGVVGKDDSQYTVEQSITMFEDNFNKETKVADVTIDGHEVTVTIDPKGNINIKGEVEKLGEVNLYIIDDKVSSCLKSICVDAEQKQISKITDITSQIDDIPNILTYGETLFETSSNGDKKITTDKGQSLTLADDGSSITVSFPQQKIKVKLNFSDDNVSLPS